MSSWKESLARLAVQLAPPQPLPPPLVLAQPLPNRRQRRAAAREQARAAILAARHSAQPARPPGR